MKQSSYREKKRALIEEITAAFNGVERENGVTLHEAMVLDNYGGPSERAEARTKDTETRWQDVPDTDIAFSDAVLSFLDDTGLRYYLPAYISWYLRNIDNEAICYRSNTFDSVIFHLTHDPKRSERFDLLNKVQRQSIAAFLTFEAEREEKLAERHLRTSLYQGGLEKEAVE